MLDANALPNDVESLKRLVIEREAALASRDMKLREKDRQIEHLTFQLAKLRRWKFGHLSEQIESAGQMSLSLEELQAAVQEALGASPAAPEGQGLIDLPKKDKPVRRKQLPAHFERIENPIPPKECVCPDCGGALKNLGKPDESEVLEVKTVTFTVTKHIRPKKHVRSAQPSCRQQRQHGRSRRALPERRSWLWFWYGSTASTCRCIGNARSSRMPD